MTRASLESRARARELLEERRALAASGRPNRWIPHAPTKKQRAFLGMTCLEALYGGAAGGGKSDALLMAALQHVDAPGYTAILFRRTFTDLALPDAIMDRSHQWLGGTDASWNGDKKTWTFPSGAKLVFGYLDSAQDVSRYQSAAFQFIGFDELTHFTERQYRYLFSRLRRSTESAVPLRMRSATNPGGIGHEWVKTRWAIPDEVDFSRVYGAGDRLFLPARRDENPHLDQDAYGRSLAELDSVTRAQLDLGRWVRDSSGLVYRLDETRNVVDALPVYPEDEWRWVLGIDYGNVDATALAVLGWHRFDDALYVAESQKWDNLDPEDAAEVVRNWSRRYSFERMVGDVGGLGKGYAEHARRRWALPIEPAQKTDKLGFIKLLNGDLEKRRLLIVRDMNEDLISEMRELAWKDERQQEEMPRLPNHCCDAMLYGYREAKHFYAERRQVDPEPGTPEWYRAEEERMLEEAIERQKRRLDDDGFGLEDY